jgi:4-amino-4-deoxy-L-arabinose transferase-like glycosyltransferase
LESSAGSEFLPGRRYRWLREFALVAGVTALAAALRIFALGEIPPGLYHDEAFNGLDGLSVLRGEWPIYFAANRGREPLFIYLIAATVNLLGRTPGALRLAAAVCGTLTIPATYLMAHAWFNRRLALLSAAILATTLWHVHLSRIGFRAVTLPLAMALVLWLGARAARSHRRRDWLLAGLLYGLSFYAYLPVRVTPFVLAAFVIYFLSTGQGDHRWSETVFFVAGTLATLAPLAIYAVGHWDAVMGRPGQASVFNPLINGGDLWGTLSRQLIGTLGMFFVRGDAIPRHNLPGRPVFDPLMGAAMVWGLVQALLRARRRETASAFALIWVGLMFVPTWLAEDAPHFLRAVGVLPLLIVFPALGLDAALTWLERRVWRGWAIALVCAVLAVSLVATVRDYFVRYGTDLRTVYAFEKAAAELAAEVNRFTGVGWNGSGLVALADEPRPERQVYVDSRLWDEWAAIPFLVPESERVLEFSPGAPVALTGATLLLIWPHDGVEQYLVPLPRNVRIEAHTGPLAQGDLEAAPYLAYVAYIVTPGERPSADYLARFGEQIALVDYTVKSSDQEWKVRLEWEALASPLENYTVFVHLHDGERLVDQDDGEPAEGYHPTSLWRSGDTIVDTRVLESPEKWVSEPRLVVGLYVWPTMKRLEVVAPSGELLGDELVLPINE